MIRESRANNEPIRNYKLGVELGTAEALNWGFKLSKLTATKHKNILLRIAHGEIYTKERLLRFNLSDNDQCPRCGRIETLRHKFIECDYVSRIWQAAQPFKNKLLPSANRQQLDSYETILGCHMTSNTAILTLNAEILLRIMYLKENQNYMMHPKALVMLCLKSIARNDKAKAGTSIKALLEQD